MRLLAALAVACLAVGAAGAATGPKVLRVPFIIAETSFDPAAVSGLSLAGRARKS